MARRPRFVMSSDDFSDAERREHAERYRSRLISLGVEDPVPPSYADAIVRAKELDSLTFALRVFEANRAAAKEEEWPLFLPSVETDARRRRARQPYHTIRVCTQPLGADNRTSTNWIVHWVPSGRLRANRLRE